MKSSFRWLAAAAIIIIIFGTMFATVQNVQRNHSSQSAHQSKTSLKSEEDETLKIAAFGCLVSLLILSTVYVLDRPKQ